MVSEAIAPSIIGRYSLGQSFSLWLPPLPLFDFFPQDLRVKVPFYWKSADLNQLDYHKQAWNRTLIFNVGKISPFNPNHFCQCFSRHTFCLSCGFEIWHTENYNND
jgi:hypothetical protein